MKRPYLDIRVPFVDEKNYICDMQRLLDRIKGRAYRKSSHRKTYEKIAAINRLHPSTVYCIAHGRVPTNKRESAAESDLLAEKIIKFTQW